MRFTNLALAAALSLSSCAYNPEPGNLGEIIQDARDVLVIENVYKTGRGQTCDALLWPHSGNCGIFCYADEDDIAGFAIRFLLEERTEAQALDKAYCNGPTYEIKRLFEEGIPLDLGLDR